MAIQRAPFLLLLIFLPFSIPVESSSSQAFVVGRVICLHCSHQYALPGAAVAVECKTERPGGMLRVEGHSDKSGSFTLRLPPAIAASPRRVRRRCAVRLVRGPHPLFCNFTSSSKPFSAMPLLYSSEHGSKRWRRSHRIYSAGSLVSQTMHSTSCSSSGGFKQNNDIPFPPLFPPLVPPLPFLAPPPLVPGLPLPPAPFLTPLPGMPPIPFVTPPPPPLIPGLPLPPIPPLPPIHLLPLAPHQTYYKP